MMLRKQTVWLLTMLAVMVVLSGYYLVKGTDEQLPAVGGEQQLDDEFLGVEVETQPADQPAEPGEGAADGTVDSETAAPVGQNLDLAGGSEFFLGYKMKRDAMIQQEKDEQRSIMTDPEASPQAVAEAKARYEELSDTEQAVLALEELIKAKGYKDAVVTTNDQNVSVYVQKEKLQPQEVVEIIAMVKQHLNVSGTQVIVSARP